MRPGNPDLPHIFNDHCVGFDGLKSKEAPVVNGGLLKLKTFLPRLQLIKLQDFALRCINSCGDVTMLQTVGQPSEETN